MVRSIRARRQRLVFAPKQTPSHRQLGSALGESYERVAGSMLSTSQSHFRLYGAYHAFQPTGQLGHQDRLFLRGNSCRRRRWPLLPYARGKSKISTQTDYLQVSSKGEATESWTSFSKGVSRPDISSRPRPDSKVKGKDHRSKRELKAEAALGRVSRRLTFR